MRSLWPAVAVACQRSPSHAGFAWHALVVTSLARASARFIESLARASARFIESLARASARFDNGRAGSG